ncbi:prenyltransferase [Stratiformator vulcanicus]|uniref:Prenyltransferase n=2 Tax=Stratiformator vulcanicus TaxID=2527980 RepID=A0A517R6H5_9PLAN|nr:prenyltransferase [Stratiformator vulcanicus]
MRLPAVFSAMSNIAAGYALAGGDLSTSTKLLWLGCAVLASVGLYLSGMIWNDVFDRAADEFERPERPIPSGAISPKAAGRLASALMLAGILFAAALGMGGVIIALLIAGAVFAYDGLLKETFVGPGAMGLCRLLNVLLGAAAVGMGTTGDVLPMHLMPAIIYAAVMGVYIGGVTWFARTESQQSGRIELIGAAIIINGAILLFAAALGGAFSAEWFPDVGPVRALICYAALAFSLNMRIGRAVKEPTPRHVQTAVRVLLLTVIVLDAAAVYAASGNVVAAGITAALIVPTVALARRMAVT